MAHFSKVGKKHRAEIARKGQRLSKTFDTKAEAQAWAVREEAAILASANGSFPKRTLQEACDKYVQEVSVHKAGARFEELRLAALCRDYPELARTVLHKVTTTDLALWRDDRLKKVTKGAVQRDINLISNLFTIARKEWRWCGESPVTNMRAPGDNPARERLPTRSEVRRILRHLGHRTGDLPGSKTQEVGFAFLIGLHTGMRAGEILQLCPAVLHGNVAVVAHKMQYKTGKPRRVPLSQHAVKLLAGFPGFTISSSSLDSLFRKCTDSLLIHDLHFHDSRASALTRMSQKVDVLELARVSGHKDLRVLNEVYYRKSSEDIGLRL